jgi:dipeptidase D
MSDLKNLEPKVVWEHFNDILAVPRPSKKEEKIIAFLLDFGKKHNLETKRDEIGNVLISKPATPGKESVKTIILQSHTDMVCEKNSDVEHDFENDPIKAYIDGEWVTAKGTTLGADDGIGIAAQMAILSSDDLEHGPIECLFTVDEETGLSGAFALQPGFMTGNTLLNLDSEDEGELFIGCAGGIDTVAKFKFKREKFPDKYVAYKISVTGLKGGHSGDEIHKGLGNSNKIMTRFLAYAQKNFKIRLNNFDGGNLRNAIPREAFATIILAPKYKEDFEKYFDEFIEKVKFELAITEPDLKMTLEESELPKFVIDKKTTRNLLGALYACPHGVINMSTRMPGMVETSTNLASVKFTGKNYIEVVTSQRSDIDSGKDYVSKMVASVFNLAGAKVRHSDGYPGWSPNPDSEIMKLTRDTYARLFGNEPVVRSIHAGLECGLFLEKYPDMDMISFGPTLRMVHSPDERIHIGTVQKFWDLLVEVLKTVK